MLGIHLLFLSMALVMLGTGLGLLVGVIVALDGFTTSYSLIPPWKAALIDRMRPFGLIGGILLAVGIIGSIIHFGGIDKWANFQDRRTPDPNAESPANSPY